MRMKQRGDTIVEVMVAFAVFALVSVGAITVMNKGLSLSQQSLELTLVRQQIDGQAELLRYARDTQGSAWQDIKARLASSVNDRVDVSNGCPSVAPAGAFVLYVEPSSNQVTYHAAGSSPKYAKSNFYSKVDLSTGQANGLWVVPVRVSGDVQGAYDMYIQACWDSGSMVRPEVLGTIVRLYES